MTSTATTEGVAFTDAPRSAASTPTTTHDGADAGHLVIPTTSRTLIALGINAGVVITMIGFALIFYTWARVAGESEIDSQLSYLVSSGLGGIGMILVGLALASISVSARDAFDQQGELRTMVSLLTEIRDQLDRDREGQP